MKKINIIIIAIVFMFIGLINVNAKIVLQECEYTDEFKKYMKLSESEKNKYIITPTMCKNAVANTAVNLKSSSLGSADATSFDLRTLNKVTSVKDQDPSGSCWTFATNASIESNLLVNGKGEKDLSEAHMELATQNTFALNIPTFNRTFNTGGNYHISSAYVMNGRGPVYESTFPFSIEKDLINNSATSYDTTNVTNKKAEVSVDNAIWVTKDSGESCSKSHATTSQIKNLLVTHGAVAAMIAWDQETGMSLSATGTPNTYEVKGNYINGAYYYYNGSGAVDHAVTIVGWDDTISKDNFSSSNKPSSDGAWIVKNSWGTVYDGNSYNVLMGDEGYYYVSYEDKHICDFSVSFQNASTTVPNNTYYYDELGYSGYLTSPYDIYSGRVFEKKGNGEEKLDKVTFFNMVEGDVGQQYEVYYADSNLENKVKIASGTTKELGYVSVTPNQTINIDDDFSIIVLYKKSGEKAYIPASAKTTGGYSWDNNTITADVDYVSIDADEWTDTSTENVNLTIRAYTTNLNGDNNSNNENNTNDDQNNSTDDQNNSSDSSSDDNGVNDKEEIEIKPNPKNEQSYIDTTNSSSESNPKTDDVKINILICTLIVLSLVVYFAVIRLRKLSKIESKL